MHGPTFANLILVVALVLLLEGAAEAAEAPPSKQVSEARRALLDNHPVAAIGSLEAALADPNLRSSADKQTVLGLLRQSYEAAADQAEAAGRPLEGESYRENARILRRRTGTTGGPSALSPAPATAPGPRPIAPEPTAPAVVEAAPPVVEGPADAPLALPDMTNQPTTTPVDPPSGSLGESARSTARPEPMGRPSGLDQPSQVSQAPSEPTGPGLAEADAAFRAKKYAEAGRIYEALARENQLPVDRREHWAYCRSSLVARRIAAKPKTEAEWVGIDAEIEQIRALAPNNWLGDYLRNRASARPSAKKLAQGGATVVRAASPEEAPPLAGRAARSAPTPAPANNLAAMANPPARAGVPVGRWQIRESANFRVFHVDPKIAEKAVQIAEATRRDQTKRWSGSLPPAPWQPKCEVYLYPTAAQYAQMTGQPDDSPGFSTMGMNQGEIISRRVNVRTDHEGLLTAVLPHEVTHVILADFFREQQIPRWADEGMAVLTEPATEQKRRAIDLVEPLGKNLLFPIETLMKMDYPDNRYWSLYYAQSVSLTRFLVEQGTPAQLVEFLQGSQANGFEAELRRVYKIDGFNDLQARWVVYARANLEGNAPTATASNAPRPDARTR